MRLTSDCCYSTMSAARTSSSARRSSSSSLLASSSSSPSSTSTLLCRSRSSLSSITLQSLFVLLAVLSTCTQLSHGYPAAMIVFHQPHFSSAAAAASKLQGGDRGTTVSKRAFDRLDMSPFDFEALSKRYNDDDDYYRKKKTFDRLDENGFFGMLRKRRAFDRLDDNSFMLGRKRRAEGTWPTDSLNQEDGLLLSKRPFDRLDASAFGMSKKSETKPRQRLSIAQVIEQYPEFFRQQQPQDFEPTEEVN